MKSADLREGEHQQEVNAYEEFYKTEFKDNWKENYYADMRGALNRITIRDLQFEVAFNWIEKELADTIYRKVIQKWGDEEGYSEASFILTNHILLHLHSDFFVDILFYDSAIHPSAEELVQKLESLKASDTGLEE
jgi:hypothetical protein